MKSTFGFLGWGEPNQVIHHDVAWRGSTGVGGVGANEHDMHSFLPEKDGEHDICSPKMTFWRFLTKQN